MVRSVQDRVLATSRWAVKSRRAGLRSPPSRTSQSCRPLTRGADSRIFGAIVGRIGEYGMRATTMNGSGSARAFAPAAIGACLAAIGVTTAAGADETKAGIT